MTAGFAPPFAVNCEPSSVHPDGGVNVMFSEFDPQQTRATRVAVDAFLKKTNAQLWIQHDFNGNAKLKKSPSFYE